MRQVIARFAKGKTTIETSGYAGAECQAATADLERRLGKTINDRPTDEMYKAVVVEQGQQQ